ncbi:branched-chain amino acid ABC transporter permease [Thermodesulfobacteriota bacterium]
MDKNKAKKQAIGAAALIAIVLLIPLFFASEPYRLSIMIFILINVVFAVSMRLIMTTEQITLGHAAFGAIGGYTSAMLATRLEWSFWITLPLAALVAVFFSLLIGYMTLKLKGGYFAILTFALSEVIRYVFQTFRGTFGGSFGIVDIPPPNAIPVPGLLEISFDTRISSYYLIAVFAILAVGFMYRIEKSRYGLILKSIGEADVLTEHTGVNILNYKVLAFTIGSTMAAMAGVFQTHYMGLITPLSFTFHQTVEYLIFVVIGGTGYFMGPILGAFILTALPEILKPLREYEPIIYAMVLLIGVLYVPEGLMGLPKKIFKRSAKGQKGQ